MAASLVTTRVTNEDGKVVSKRRWKEGVDVVLGASSGAGAEAYVPVIYNDNKLKVGPELWISPARAKFWRAVESTGKIGSYMRIDAAFAQKVVSTMQAPVEAALYDRSSRWGSSDGGHLLVLSNSKHRDPFSTGTHSLASMEFATFEKVRSGRPPPNLPLQGQQAQLHTCRLHHEDVLVMLVVTTAQYSAHVHGRVMLQEAPDAAPILRSKWGPQLAETSRQAKDQQGSGLQQLCTDLDAHSGVVPLLVCGYGQRCSSAPCRLRAGTYPTVISPKGITYTEFKRTTWASTWSRSSSSH
jgi:hypothetical protein